MHRPSSLLSFALVLGAVSCPRPSQASDLNLALKSGSSSTVIVGPGRNAPYQIVGTLSDNASAGLAYFSLDLAFSGGPLQPASNPIGAPMNQFALPLGLTNPAGFGGTPVGGQLKQVGGAMNTIRNTFASAPIGSVIPNLALPGSSQVLVTGSLTAPYEVGSYTLSASNLKANVLRTGQTGVPFWKVDKASAGTVSNLNVSVQAIIARPSVVHVQQAQQHYMAIDAGPNNAGRPYLCLGSISGTSPGITLPGGELLPLNNDGYFQYTLNNPNSPILSGSFGVLDAQGRGTVTFRPTRRFVGRTVHHAFYLTGSTVDFVSEAEPVQVVN
jgi:hypothetical protein